MRRLLLDFGGVVIKTPFELLHRVGHAEWTGPFDPSSDDLWRDMQAGRITERDYWHHRAREIHPDAEDPIFDLMHVLYLPPADEVVRPETMKLLAEVDRPAVLTNDLTKFHAPDWLESMGLARTFDPLIDLSFAEQLKPHPAAYRHAIERLDVDQPDQIVFADDQPGNVEGAASQGLTAIWFDVTDPFGSVERIRSALE